MKLDSKPDRPISLQAFMRRFPDDAACADFLARRRWPEGFRCPACPSEKGWKLDAKPWTWECAACHRQTSVTAGTIMHRTHLPLRTWFLAAHLVATHSNGISALQLQTQAGIGSYKSAWFLLHRLRKSMVNEGRSPLAGLVEVDETSIIYRTKDEPATGGQGRSLVGKLIVLGAVEVTDDGSPGRIRLSYAQDFLRTSLHSFVAAATATGSTISTDGYAAYDGVPDRKHLSEVIKGRPAHLYLPWIHRVFSNLKRWGLGVYHGFRKRYIQAYLDEFTFRWNRRKFRAVSFERLLGIGMQVGPMPLRVLMGR